MRPRLLLVPDVTELEWRIKPLLQEWAEVASYDAPGVGDEPPTSYSREAVAERGLAELDRRGWDSCVLAADEFATATAVQIAAARPDAVEALALGHASLSFRGSGERAPINSEVNAALNRVERADYRSYVRALSQVTQHAYDDDFADRYRERVSQEAATAYFEARSPSEGKQSIEPTIRSLGIPLLFVEHRGCLLFTREGYEDAVAAFPEAETASMEIKPSANPDFSEILKRFCAKLPSQAQARAQGGR